MSPMRVRSTSQVHVDLITSQSDVAELAKAAQRLGYRMVLDPYVAGDGSGGSSALLSRVDETWGSNDLVDQVVIHAIAADQSPSSILAQITAGLNTLKMPLDVRPSDARPIGEG